MLLDFICPRITRKNANEVVDRTYVLSESILYATRVKPPAIAGGSDSEVSLVHLGRHDHNGVPTAFETVGRPAVFTNKTIYQF